MGDPWVKIADDWDRNDGLDAFYGETKQEMVERWDREYPPTAKSGRAAKSNGHASSEVISLDTGARLDTERSLLLIKSSREFVDGFVPPDYLVDGLLQEAFLYSLTGATGAGKTAITLRLAASIASGTAFANRESKKRRVLYLAAENPVDVRMRWIALAQQMNFDARFNRSLLC
jgi:AAA domain